MKTLLFILMTTFFSGSISQFKINDIEGKPIDFSKFRGKKILLVNTASECGFTPQYAELEKLHQKYKSQLVVIGVPANNFGGQEPGSASQIKAFCSKNYGVTFLLTEKISVQGNDIHPLFKHLTQEKNSDFAGDIKWNFEKFLLDESGNLIHRYRSNVKPMDKQIIEAISR